MLGGIIADLLKLGGAARPEWVKKVVGAVSGSPRAGFVGMNAAVGLAKGAALGGGMWALSGDASWMPLMMGMGAYRGGSKAMISSRDSKVKKGFEHMLGGTFAPGKLTRNFAIGAGIGLATGDPNFGVYGALGIPAASFLLRSSFRPRGGLRTLKAFAQAPFSPTAAMRTMQGVSEPMAFASMGFVGLLAGGAAGATKTMMGGNKDVNSGYYPGGVMPLMDGGRGIPNNHLNTEGLTLALHKNARKTRVM